MKNNHTKNNFIFMKEKIKRKKSECKSKNMGFNLGIEYLLEIMTEKCPISGDSIEYCHRKNFIPEVGTGLATLCRINRELGFVKGNVVWKSRKSHLYEFGLEETPTVEYDPGNDTSYQKFLDKMYERLG